MLEFPAAGGARVNAKTGEVQPHNLSKRPAQILTERVADQQQEVNAQLRQKAAALGLPVVEYATTLTMAVRQLDGGRQQFIQFVQLAAADGDDDALRFLAAFADLRAHEQSRASLDLVCIAAGVSPVALLKTIVGAAFEAQVDTANLIAAAAHPRVVATAVKSARRLNSEIGAKDREHLLRHHGFLPQPKSAQINIGVSASATAQAAAASAEPTVPDFLADVATVDDTRQLHGAVVEGDLLPADTETTEATE